MDIGSANNPSVPNNFSEFDPRKLPPETMDAIKSAKVEFEKKQLPHECKNSGCENERRSGSSYCQECSDKYKENS